MDSAICKDDWFVKTLFCSVAHEAISLLIGTYNVSKNKREVLKSLSTCTCVTCFDCKAVKIILSNKLLRKQLREFSDEDMEYADRHSQYSYGCMLLLAIILVQRQNQSPAIRLFKKLADKGFAVACLYLAKMPHGALPIDEVKHYLEKAHELGAYSATMLLGEQAFNRHKKDAENAQAFVYFKMVENTGLRHALRTLGKWNEHPLGPRNFEEAERLYRLAARQGDAVSNYKLGCIFTEGKHLPKDSIEAEKCFCAAATSGHVDAQLALGYMYVDGDGVVKDEEKARSWFTLAAEQGNQFAKLMLLPSRS